MVEGVSRSVNLKRRREGKTDYDQRLQLLKSGKTRAVVRLTNRRAIVQFIDYHPDGDKVRTSANNLHLEDFGWSSKKVNLPSAYLVGFLAGKRAQEEGIHEAVLDIGMNKPEKGGKIFSALNGLIDSGVDIPHDPDILPSEERTKGEHIGEDTVQRFEEVKGQLEEL